MPPYTRLRGVSDFNQETLRRTIELNVVDFLAWAFVEAGAYADCVIATPGVRDPYGRTDLVPVQQNGRPAGSVWQSPQADWCYESGFDSGRDPVVATGVFVNGTFHATASASGTYSHHIDFRHGRVVFDSPVPTTSLVQATHSYKVVSVYDQTVPWFRQVVLDSYLAGQQALAVLDDNRVSTPLVVVEAVMRQRLSPYQLGNLSHWVRQDVLFHVVAEDKDTRDRIADAVSFQEDAEIYLYDVNARAADGQFPLDWRGSPVPGAINYPRAVLPPPDGYRSNVATFTESRGGGDSSVPPLYQGTVRSTLLTTFTAS